MRKYPRLTIGVLVGHESEWLDRCLGKLSDFSGPVIVVGSVRSSAVEKNCKEHGCGYFLNPSKDPFHFAEQRNRLFDYCRTPWILMLDVDETISRMGLTEAVRISESEPHRAFSVRHPYHGRYGLHLTDHQVRLLPGNGSMPFEGFVQNTPVAEHAAFEKIHPANIEIEDWGAALDPERMEHRRARYQRLLPFERDRLKQIEATEDPRAFGQLGFRYFCLGDRRQSKHFFERFQQIEPENAVPQFYLARMEAEKEGGDTEAVKSRLWGLIQNGATQYRVFQYLSKLHGDKGEWNQAFQAAEAGADRHPECASFQHHMAIAHYRMGNLESAGRRLDRCLELFPNYRPAMTLLRLLTGSLNGKDTRHIQATASTL